MNKFVLIACLGLSVQMLLAQTAPSLPDKCQVFRPALLGKPGQKVSLLKAVDAEKLMSKPYGQTGNSTKTYWTVYSDRSNNTTYKSSSSNIPYKTLSLGQAVVIAKIENDRAQVYTDYKSVSVREYPSLPVQDIDGDCLGWVPMDHLLLWDSCPTDNAGIYQKALLCVNIDAKSVTRLAKDASFKYSSPDNGNKLPLVLDEKIYFIMKRSGDFTLLATQYTMNASSSRGVLVGWVKDISYVPWNQRLCLEPTWKDDDVKFFIQNDVYATVVQKKGGASAASWRFKTIAPELKKLNDKKYKGNAPSPYRLLGSTRRFPVLSNEGVYLRVSSFSRATTKTDLSNLSASERSEQEIHQLQNINLVLLIDGTQSMGPFYPAVQQGLVDGCNALAGIKNARIKVSALIYRDKADTRGSTSYEIEPYPSKWVSPNDAGLHSFLTKGGEYGIKSSRDDKTMEESLYSGMESALSYFSGKEKQSNILLVVGDCGNLKDDARRESVVQTASSRCVQIIGYQVRLGDDKSFTAFADQLSYIMSESLKRIYASMAKAGNVQLASNLLRFRQKGNRFALDRVDANNIYRGLVICPFDGKKMSEKELKEEMVTSIVTLSQAIQEQINIIAGSNYSNTDDGKVSMEIAEAFLASRNLSSQDTGANDISFQGLTRLKDASSGRPLYNPVILLSREELTTLTDELGQVSTKAHAESEDRKPFIDAMVDLASKHFGGLSGQDLRTLSLNEIQQMIYGLPDKSSTLSNYTLEELADPKIVSNSEYRKILNEYRVRFNRLRDIRSRSDYQGRYEFNGAEYYWVPLEDLP